MDYIFLLALLIMAAVLFCAGCLAVGLGEVQQDVKKILERLEKK